MNVSRAHRNPGRRRGIHRRGAMMVLVVVLLPVLFLIAAFAINVAYVELVRTETQIATDIATRAAGRTFARTDDQQAAIAAAQAVGLRNTVAGQPFPLEPEDIVFGVSQRTSLDSRYTFEQNELVSPNSVRITSSSINTLGIAQHLAGYGPSIEFAPIRQAISTKSELDISLVIDRSGSMAYAANEASRGKKKPAAAPVDWSFGQPVPPESRWLDTVDAVDVFLDALEVSLQRERVSLITYNNEGHVEFNPTEDLFQVQSSLNQYTQAFSSGMTNIGDGIRRGAETLAAGKVDRPWATRVLIVMTDGIHNRGLDPVTAAEQAAAEGITVFSVTFSDEADIARMQQVAVQGGGEHHHATSREQLCDAFEEITRQLPTLLTR